jgi:hypothetical protein
MNDEPNVEPTPAKLALSVNEVLARVPVKRTRLYEELRTGRLRRKKIGSRTVILAADLDTWLANLTPASSGQGA